MFSMGSLNCVLRSCLFALIVSSYLTDAKFNFLKILFGGRTSQSRCPNCYCGISYSGRTPRLLDGPYIAPSEFPWTVFVGIKNALKSGTLINDLYVLTSASNIYHNMLDLKVHIGKYQICAAETTHIITGVASIIIHPGFIPIVNIHDIAMLKLTTRIQFNSHRLPICLPVPGVSYIGKVGIVAGFIEDHTDFVTGKVNTCLPRKATLPIVSRWECNRSLYGFEMCLGIVGADNIICEADNGAGVMYRTYKGYHELVGVLSNKQSCPPSENVYYSPKDLAVMTSIASHYNWLIENTEDACYCTKI